MLPPRRSPRSARGGKAATSGTGANAASAGRAGNRITIGIDASAADAARGRRRNNQTMTGMPIASAAAGVAQHEQDGINGMAANAVFAGQSEIRGMHGRTMSARVAA